MITSGLAKFERMKIQPYSDKEFKDADAVGEAFEVTINPETYTIRYKPEYCETQAPGTSMPILRFNKIAAQEISFDFLFDSTGVKKDPSPVSIGLLNPLEKPKSVADKVDEFRKKIIDYKSTIHRPFYLKILWGKLIFKCVLANLDIEYKLFTPDGTPIRAIAKCTFKGSIDEVLRKAIENKQSPDVTHERIVKASDRLSLMTYKIYNRQDYLPYVAAFNQLDGFRNVSAGTRIYFPPVEK
jgi:hypothetical protein